MPTTWSWSDVPKRSSPPPEFELRPWSDEEIEILLTMMTQGATKSEIGERLGRPRAHVYAKVKRMRGAGLIPSIKKKVRR